MHQIRAVVAFGDVEAGEIGGWIEKEENLAHDGNAWVCDNARVCGDARVCDNARVYGNACVYGNAWVCDNARVYGDAWVCDNARVCDNACVCGNACVYGNAWVCGDARVYGDAHWLGIACIGSRNGFTTFFRAKEKRIRVACGCFRGDIDEFAAKVKKTHGDNEHAKAYLLAIELAKLRIDLSGEDSEPPKGD